jgi:hypothetical protein
MFGAYDVETDVVVNGDTLCAYARAYVSGELGQDLDLDEVELEGVPLAQLAPELREPVRAALLHRAWALAQSGFESRSEGSF